MAQTIETCPYYDGWLKTVEDDLKIIREGILKKDFTAVGSQTEYNCLKMHALMLTTKPAIIYWLPITMEVIHNVVSWRENGLECYFTIDAGPQVKIICLKKDVPEIKKRLKNIEGIKRIIVSKSGKGVRLIDKPRT